LISAVVQDKMAALRAMNYLENETLALVLKVNDSPINLGDPVS